MGCMLQLGSLHTHASKHMFLCDLLRYTLHWFHMQLSDMHQHNFLGDIFQCSDNHYPAHIGVVLELKESQ